MAILEVSALACEGCMYDVCGEYRASGSDQDYCWRNGIIYVQDTSEPKEPERQDYNTTTDTYTKLWIEHM